jgi:hypothetical protein
MTRIRHASVAFAGIALAGMGLMAMAPPPAEAPGPSGNLRQAAAAAGGPYVTLLFSRTEITAADNCVRNDAGVARLDTVVAPYLAGRGMTATGTLVTAKTKDNAFTCTHTNSSLMGSWAQATTLAAQYGWSFVSHTATYPSNLAGLTPAQSQAETCGSAQAIDSHGLPGGHGMIAYPGAQPLPVALQTNYASKCFAWGRRYGGNGITSAADGAAAPYWQNTIAPNGGPCNVSTAACYTIVATGSKRYVLPSKDIAIARALVPGQWFSLQAYLLVTGKSPAYSSSPIRWDCTSANPRMHWSNDNERYCYKDWQTIIYAIAAVPGVVVTDPLTVGIAFGRPATFP